MDSSTAPVHRPLLNNRRCSHERDTLLSPAPAAGSLRNMRATCIALLVLSALASPMSAQAAQRDFGAYVDPWHFPEWSQRVGAAPQFVSRFEAFSRGQTVDSFLREAERQGLQRVMVTWEPWKPVPP